MLGSPNDKCNPSGPGVRSGGEPGESGENCVPQGNVLIFQATGNEQLRPQENGGTQKFMFSSKVKRVIGITLMGITNNSTLIKVGYLNQDGVQKVRNLPIKGLGENSVQRIPLARGVFAMNVYLAGPGAVASLELCVFGLDSSPPTVSPVSLPTKVPSQAKIALESSGAPVTVKSESPSLSPTIDSPEPPKALPAVSETEWPSTVPTETSSMPTNPPTSVSDSESPSASPTPEPSAAEIISPAPSTNSDSGDESPSASPSVDNAETESPSATPPSF